MFSWNVAQHLQPRVGNTCSHTQQKVSLLFTYPFHLLFACCDKARVFLAVNICLETFSSIIPQSLLSLKKQIILHAPQLLLYASHGVPEDRADNADFSQNDIHRKAHRMINTCVLTGAVGRCTAPGAVLLTVSRHTAYQQPSVQTRVLNH